MDQLYSGKIEVVIAHYNEDLTWTNGLKYPVKIYSKTNPQYNLVEKNKGQEVPCFLKYILDNYNNLPDKVIFLHGHKISNHMNLPADFIVNYMKVNKFKYISLGREDWYDDISVSEPKEWEYIINNWDKAFINLPKPTRLVRHAGGQFLVDKSYILHNSYNFYKHCYDWIQNTEEENYWTSRLFEHTWHYIFTHYPIEAKKDTNRILYT